MKGAVLERFNKSLKARMYRISQKNTYLHLDIMDKLLTGNNYSVHSTIDLPPSKLNPSKIYSVWKGMNNLLAKIPHGRVKFKVVI
jgi:hypothetical protein